MLLPCAQSHWVPIPSLSYSPAPAVPTTAPGAAAEPGEAVAPAGTAWPGDTAWSTNLPQLSMSPSCLVKRTGQQKGSRMGREGCFITDGHSLWITKAPVTCWSWPLSLLATEWPTGWEHHLGPVSIRTAMAKCPVLSRRSSQRWTTTKNGERMMKK